jgi:PilZ domain
VEAHHRVEARLCPRFKLDANLKIHCGTELLSGYALDISESGISAMLPIEVSMGEIVDLDFELPLGPVRFALLCVKGMPFVMDSSLCSPMPRTSS